LSENLLKSLARSRVYPNHRFNTRNPGTRKALFRRIAELLGESPGIRPEDVFVNILEAQTRTGPSATASRNLLN
jgi:hypothetical protein